MFNYRSVEDLNKLLKGKMHLVPKVDAIAGIPRSGMLPASLLALYLGKPLLTIDQLSNGYYQNYTNRISLPDKARSILVIDDSCSTGNCMKKIKTSLSWAKGLTIYYAAVYVTEQGKQFVDFYFEECGLPRLFEWNIMDHITLQNSCVDLDGILCKDPAPEENDDGERYLNFIRNAIPLFTPYHAIKAIVTCRLGKYRAETENWLKTRNMKFRELYMMPYATAAERKQANNYAGFKADIYKQLNASLFIESEYSQAIQIYKLTRKPVYCLQTNELYQ